MNNWRKIPFGNILKESRDGEWGEGNNAIGYQLCNIIRGTDFSSLYSMKIELPQRWVKDHLIERKKLRPLDIIFEMAGGTANQSTGRSALIKSSLFNRLIDKPLLCASFCRHLRLDQEHYSPHFIYYLLQALYDYGYMAVFNIQHTGVSRFQYTSFKKRTNLNVPPLPIQRKIAAILSAYDDLIENNNRRIAILDKMTEELYCEWFVLLRFPGHEKVKIVKGVPEGWEVKKIGECFTTYLGGTPSRDISSYWGGNIPWINSGEINKLRIINASEFITELGYSKSATKIMPVHTTVLAITGATLGQVSFTELEVCANQSVVGIYDDNDLFNYYIFGYINCTIQNLIAKQGGGGQQHINKDIIEKELIILPSQDLLIEYNRTIIPIFKQIANKYFLNERLKLTRDRLLSRLMSGKIDVEDLDILFPTSMQEDKVTTHA